MQNKEIESWQNIAQKFLANLDILKHITIEERNNLMNAACIVLATNYENTLKSKYITLLYHIAFLDNISLEESWQIFWIIKSVLFSNSEVTLLNGNLVTLYNHIYTFIDMENSTKYVYRKLETRNENYIVIVINQFLGEKHSASVRALDYCHAIKKYLHKNVLIINTSELNFYRNPQLEPSIEFNFVDQLSTISRYTYKGEDFDFYQVNSKMLNLGEIKWLIDSIYNINPLFVYNIGGSNITADLCTRFTTTASIPCSYDIPISCSKYLLVGRKLRENDKDILKLMKPYQKIIETEMNFIIAEKEATYTRKDFNIDENSFIICVVGSRLDTEVNNDFLQLVKKVIYNSDINIVFIGGMARSQAIINDILDEHKSKIHFLGVQPNASEIIRLTNLYLNPRRLGGGRSSFEALHYSVPVVTTNYGDVSYVCDNAFNVQDYDEAYQSIMEYYTNQQYYETMKKVALSRSKKLSSIEATQKYIIDAIIADETHDIL